MTQPDTIIDQDRARPAVRVIIPAWNEQDSIGLVLADIPDDVVEEVVVVNNGSTDATAERARNAGATVLYESRRGYGSACLKGLDYLDGTDTDIVVFLDADYSDHPQEIRQLVDELTRNKRDLVIGSRALGNRDKGAMPPQALFGNWLATRLIRLFWGARFTDLGPFRAIRTRALEQIRMEDKDYGWTVEMQIKAARYGLAYSEIPVSYRRRIGTSKISGTLSGTVKAGWKILFTIARYGLAGSGKKHVQTSGELDADSVPLR